MKSSRKMTLALADRGMVNNPNVCIKDFGSTVACVCKECISKSMSILFETYDKLNDNS